MVNTILILILLAGVAYIVYRVVTRYRAAEGTTWERLLATAKGSATMLWNYVVYIGGAVVAGAASLAGLLQMPEAQDWIKTNLPSEYVGLAVVGIAAISMWARLRTLKD